MKLTLIILLLITGLANAQEQLTNQRLYDTIPTMPDFWPRRVAIFEKEPVVTGKIMFLGNSITQGGDWARYLNDKSVINRGIGGDVTFGILKRLDDVILRKPSKLFILIGINDISKDFPDAVIADNCRKIIERIQKESPDTKIFLQSILPLNTAYPGFPQHYDKVAHVLSTNKLLTRVATDAGVTFINLFPLFLDKEGQLDKNYTVDGLHLNEKGYQVWVDHLYGEGYLSR